MYSSHASTARVYLATYKHRTSFNGLNQKLHTKCKPTSWILTKDKRNIMSDQDNVYQ